MSRARPARRAARLRDVAPATWQNGCPHVALLRRCLAFLACALILGAAATWVTGGFSFSVAGARVSSRDAVRPLAVAAACVAAVLLLGGAREARAVAARLRALLRALLARR